MGKLKSKETLKTEDYVIECKYTDKSGIKITLAMLEKLCKKAKSLNKIPRLVLGIKKNETQNFLLKCNVVIERK
jgi:Holliday junction resolvase